MIVNGSVNRADIVEPRRTYLSLFYIILFGSFLALQEMIGRGRYFIHPSLETPLIQTKIPSLPNTGAEARNPPYTEEGYELWEGDMILTQDQIEHLSSSSENLEIRKTTGELNYLWPDAYIPYEIDASSENERSIISAALEFLMSYTCLQFEEVPLNSSGHHLIFKRKEGCYSHVGRSWFSFPNGQVISIGEGCERVGTILHEVGHAIGFYHQQSRPDRGNHVTIFLKNVFPNKISNFDVHYDAHFYEVPYDLGSLMHYGADYFSKNGKNTIVPLDPMKQFVIGQRDTFSFYDIQLANMMYQCSDRCNSSRPVCYNGGYVDHKCVCRCPPLTTGNYCQTKISETVPACGGIITTPETITSPNFPSNYPKGSKCVWRIQAPENKKVVAFFKTFDLLYRHSGKCPWDSLEIRTNSVHEGEILCGSELQGETIESAENELIILFKSLYDWKKGFQIIITFEEHFKK